MELAESSSEPMKSRLFIGYIIKTIYAQTVFEKRGSSDGYVLSISSTKDPLWFSLWHQFIVTNIILNKTEIVIR